MVKNRDFHICTTILMRKDLEKLASFRRWSSDMGNPMTESRTIKTLMLMGWEYWMKKKNNLL